MKASIAERIQAALQQENLNGWPFYRFRGCNPKSEMLDALPGEKKVYFPWQQLHSRLAVVLAVSR